MDGNEVRRAERLNHRNQRDTDCHTVQSAEQERGVQ